MLGSKFRMINEYFYVNPSKESAEYFKENKDDFILYHSGF